MTPPCTACGTTNPGRRRIGLCTRCYRAVLERGQRQRIVVRDIPGRRFMLRVDTDGPVPAHAPELGACWLWTGATADNGYGEFRLDAERVVYAHRWAYEAAVGPIPAGFHVDHLCHEWSVCGLDALDCEHRACVNPAHLEAVDPATNNARSSSPTALNARKDECDHGHPFTPGNTYTHPQRGTRHCRACLADTRRRYEARRRMLVASAAKRRASRVPGVGQTELFVLADG